MNPQGGGTKAETVAAPGLTSPPRTTVSLVHRTWRLDGVRGASGVCGEVATAGLLLPWSRTPGSVTRTHAVSVCASLQVCLCACTAPVCAAGRRQRPHSLVLTRGFSARSLPDVLKQSEEKASRPRLPRVRCPAFSPCFPRAGEEGPQVFTRHGALTRHVFSGLSFLILKCGVWFPGFWVF